MLSCNQYISFLLDDLSTKIIMYTGIGGLYMHKTTVQPSSTSVCVTMLLAQCLSKKLSWNHCEIIIYGIIMKLLD